MAELFFCQAALRGVRYLCVFSMANTYLAKHENWYSGCLCSLSHQRYQGLDDHENWTSLFQKCHPETLHYLFIFFLTLFFLVFVHRPWERFYVVSWCCDVVSWFLRYKMLCISLFSFSKCWCISSCDNKGLVIYIQLCWSSSSNS